MSRSQRWFALFAGAAAMFMLGAVTVVWASGNATYRTGTAINKVRTATGNVDFTATDVPEPGVDLPGARLRFTNSKSALMVLRFTTTIDCTGVAGRCHANVAVLDNDNADAEVDRIEGVAHLDSTFGSEGHESHQWEGSITLPPGDYDFQVKLITYTCCGATGSISLGIPFWHFTVERAWT